MWTANDLALRPLPNAAEASHIRAASEVSSQWLGPDAQARLEHQDWVIVLNLRGRAQVHGAFGSLQLPGRQWLVLSGESVVAVSTRRRGLCLVLGLTQEACLSRLPRWEIGLISGMGRVGRALGRILGACVRAAASPDWDRWQRDSKCAMLLRELVSAQTALHASLAKAPGKSLAARLKTFARLQRACLIMACQVEREVCLQQLASACSFSVWYFSRAFRRVYDEPPHVFGARCRLRHAAWLMRSEWYPANTVAGLCGFDNPSSFARAFRREIGCTPTDYRARYLFG